MAKKKLDEADDGSSEPRPIKVPQLGAHVLYMDRARGDVDLTLKARVQECSEDLLAVLHVEHPEGVKRVANVPGASEPMVFHWWWPETGA